MISALVRAILMAIMVIIPTALVVSKGGSDSAIFVAFAAMLAAGLTFVEYNSVNPSIVEFRNAPPFNRLRFLCLTMMLLSLSLIAKHQSDPTQLTLMFKSIGTIISRALDFPYSPVRLIVLMMREGTGPQLLHDVRTAAGVAYIISLLTIATFVLIVKVLDWPARSGAFNVWINLPLFDPTAGSDVLYRLRRDSNLNIALGLLLPFLIPAVAKSASHLLDPMMLTEPRTLVWTLTAWAFLPASIIMRGIAMGRVAEMIEEKRRQAYAESAELSVI